MSAMWQPDTSKTTEELWAEVKETESTNTVELAAKCLKFLRIARDMASPEWDALIRTEAGKSLVHIWDLLHAHAKEKEHSAKIRWGQSPDDSYTEEHPYDEYTFKTVAELNAFLEGCEAANGWLDMHEYEEEKTNE